MIRFYWGIFLLILTHPVFAQQEIKSLPIQFGQYMRAYPLINPASSGSISKIEVYTGNQRHGQNWSNINTFYFNANIRFYKKNTINTESSEIEETDDDAEEEEEEISNKIIKTPVRFHVAGINIINDKEGEYFNRSGLYGIYAWHGRLTSTVAFSAGASIGLKNIAISDNYVYGGSSRFAPDGTIGLWMYNDDFHIGASIGQLFNSKLRPIAETTRLIPCYNITAGKVFNVSPFVSLKPSFLARFSGAYSPDVDLTLASLWQNVISATVSYRVNKGLVTMLGIEKITLGDHDFKAMISYAIPENKSTQINNYTYEITLNYFFNSGNRKTKVFL